MSNKLKVITPDNLGKGITFNPATKKWEVNVETGLTCASIDQLPTKPWKKGTTLLAKQDGECIKLTALDSIFQEIGVGITANKTSAFTGEEYRVVVTVSNTGEGKNDLTNLVVQKPLLGNYNIKDVTTSHQGLDSFDRKNDLTYDLKGLAKGGTFILRFTVVANDVGTFQFSASVTPNSALDQEQTNNTATITLVSNTKIDTTYVPSVDCPRITATELDSNTELQQLSPGNFLNDKTLKARVTAPNRANIFANRTTLKGLRIQLSDASSVIGYADLSSDAGDGLIIDGKSTASSLMSGDDGLYFLFEPDAIKRGDDGFTFSNGVLEITRDIKAFAFSCRPQGQNCRWQIYSLFAMIEPVTDSIEVSNNVGFKISKGVTYTNTRPFKEITSNIIPSSESSKLNSDVKLSNVRAPGDFKISEKLILTVKAGTSASINYTDRYGRVRLRSQGKTTVTDNMITVSADATSTDSVNSDFLQVIVED